MLTIMCKLSLDTENVNTHRPEMLLRTGPKVKMKFLSLVKKGYFVVRIINVIDYGISWIVLCNRQKQCLNLRVI